MRRVLAPLRRLPFAALAMLCLFACGDSASPTRVILTITAEPGVLARAGHTRLVVSGLVGGIVDGTHDDLQSRRPASFPYKIELTPKDGDAARTYRVEVSAFDANGAFAFASLSSGYVAHQTRYVTLALEDACLGIASCGADLTCHAGHCSNARVGAEALPTKPGVAVIPDPGSTPDAGVPVADASVGPPVDSATPAVPADAAVADASVSPPDAQTPVTPVDNDAGVVPPTQPCSGPRSGIWRGTVIPDQLDLMASCAFSYTTPACASIGTYTRPLGDSGSLILTVTSATSGAYTADNGVVYGCLPVGSYACSYVFTGTSFTYECGGNDPVTYVR